MGRAKDLSAGMLEAAGQFGELFLLWLVQKKWRLFGLLLFELWVHSLLFQHLTELKSLTSLIPFLDRAIP